MAETMKACKYCATPFIETYGGQEYCCDKCKHYDEIYTEYLQKLNEVDNESPESATTCPDADKREIPKPRRCEVCGQLFRPTLVGQEYCSIPCVQQAAKGLNIWNSIKCKEEFMQLQRRLFELLGDNPDRPGLLESPRRILGMYLEVLEGQIHTNDEIAEMYNKCFDDDSEVGGFDGMVTMRDIPIFSFCEHHMALMYNMRVNIGYIPKDKVIGLSKMARIADMVGKRLQLQEKIGNDIRYIMSKILGTEDVIVVIEGEHGCMTTRGIRKPGVSTVTSSLGGVFAEEPATRAEFYSKLDIGK